MSARHLFDGSYCCECDYCATSPCDDGPVHTAFLTDHRESHNYYSFCETHRAAADEHIRDYLAAHHGVQRETEDE